MTSLESRLLRLLPPLLDEQADVGKRILPFSFSQLSLPRVHRAEDNTVLDRPKQLFVCFEEGFKSMKIGRRHPQ